MKGGDLARRAHDRVLFLYRRALHAGPDAGRAFKRGGSATSWSAPLEAQLRPASADDHYMTVPSGERPMLRLVLDEALGTSSARIQQALGLLLEELGMDVAFVGELDDGARVVTYAANAPGATPVPVGLAHPVQDTLCHLFITGEVGPIVADAAAHPALAGHPHPALFGVGSYAGVPLRVGGTVVGALCCAAASPVRVIEEREIATLQTVAEYVSELLWPASPDARRPARQAMTTAARDNLERVAGAFADGPTLELLSRPLLEMLQEATGLDSTYLTTVDWPADEQRILYALNTAEMQIPEGLVVEWSDTLCRRSLDEGRACTTDVPTV